MAVLAEAISVIVRADALLRAFGTFEAFKATIPNQTLSADNELARVGFMSPEDVESFVGILTAKGLIFVKNGHAQDFVVVDQQRGPTSPCDWLEFGRVNLGSDPAKRVAACRLRGSSLKQVVMPDGWQYEGSLSQTFGFVPAEHLAKVMQSLGHEDGVDVYRSKLTKAKAFLGRAFPRKAR